MKVKLRFPYLCLFPSPKQAAEQTTLRYPCVMHAAVLQLAAPGAFFVFPWDCRVMNEHRIQPSRY